MWVLRRTGVRAYVTDPPAGDATYDLCFDLTQALVKYYRVVLDAAGAVGARAPKGLVRLDIADGRALFVEGELLGVLQGLENRATSGEDVLAVLEARSRAYRRISHLAARSRRLAFGLDGVGLVGPTDDEDEEN